MLLESLYPNTVDPKLLCEMGRRWLYRTHSENGVSTLAADPLTEAFVAVLTPRRDYCPQAGVKSWITVLDSIAASPPEPGLEWLCQALCDESFLATVRVVGPSGERTVPAWTRCVAALTVHVVREKESDPNARLSDAFLATYGFTADGSLRRSLERSLRDYYEEAHAVNGPAAAGAAFYWLGRALAHLAPSPGKGPAAESAPPWQISAETALPEGAIPICHYFSCLARRSMEGAGPEADNRVFQYLRAILERRPEPGSDYLPGRLFLSRAQKARAWLTGNPHRLSWTMRGAAAVLVLAAGLLTYGLWACLTSSRDLQDFCRQTNELQQQLSGK